MRDVYDVQRTTDWNSSEVCGKITEEKDTSSEAVVDDFKKSAMEKNEQVRC